MIYYFYICINIYNCLYSPHGAHGLLYNFHYGIGAYNRHLPILFLVQRNAFRPAIEFSSKIDTWFTLKPHWIWIYSGLYYPIIIFMIFSFQNMRHFNYTVFSFFMLLVFQMLFFLFLPVKTPDSWRLHTRGNNLSVRFLNYVQSMDKSSNCFPSMHVSVSTLTACHLFINLPDLGYYIFLFPVIIALSALYTKQHYFWDLLPGAGLGALCFKLFLMIY